MITVIMYGKIFKSMFDGSMRGRSDEILVFVNLLANCDEGGFVDRHFRAISEETGLPMERVVKAIENLEAPDQESRSKELEGRRLERLDEHRNWGWRIVNHGKYRALQREADRRAQLRDAQKRFRDKSNQTVITDDYDSLPAVSVSASESAPEKEGAGEKTKESGIPANEKEAIEWADMGMIPAAFAKRIYNQLEGRNWKDGAGQPVTNFRKHIKYRWQKEQETKAKEPPKMLDYAP